MGINFSLFNMKFILLIATLFAVVACNEEIFETSELLSHKVCMKMLRNKVVPAIHAADTNDDGYLTRRESWVWWKKHLHKQYAAWAKKHYHKLSADGKKKFWQHYRATMKKVKARNNAFYKKFGKNKIHVITYYKWWYKMCRKYNGKN